MKPFLLFLCLAVVACSHSSPQKETPREPAAFNVVEESHLTPEEVAEMEAVVANKNGDRVQHLLTATRVAQILVASFDSRIEKIKTEGQADKLLNSKLYCKLMDARGLHKEVEEKLTTIFAAAAKSGPEGKNWFLNEVVTFAKKEPMSEIAAIQVLRLLVQNEETYCGGKDCLAADVRALQGFQVAPLDDEALLAYTDRYKVIYGKVKDADLEPGSCLSEARLTNVNKQIQEYDWKNRNWTGAILPQGHFVFTYDDGPHPQHTRKIRDAWANAGMAKPAYFWLANNAKNYSSIVQEFGKQGYPIASHSERHGDLGNLARSTSAANLNGASRTAFRSDLAKVAPADYANWKVKTLDREINQSLSTIGSLSGKRVPYFRLPYGSGVKNAAIGRRFQDLNIDHFFWRVDSLDWQDKNPASIRNRVVTQMKSVGRGIVLFHDIHAQSAQATQLIVDFLKANPNYKAVSIQSLPGVVK